MNLYRELRILLADWLLRRAMQAMPADAPEARPLADAIDRYRDQATQISRWEKFPA